MKINQLLVPKSRTNNRPGYPMKPEYITIHETANTSKGADAESHARYLYNGAGGRTVGWHYTVDDRSIWQSIPDNEATWHAGDGSNGTGNRKSLAIEICVNSDGDFAKARRNAAWLTAKKMVEHKILLSRVVQHNKWSGKNCPAKIRGSGLWSEFLEMAEEEYKKMTAPSQPASSVPYPGYLIKRGSRGEVVKMIQRKLGGLEIDGIFGPRTEARVKEFQRSKGLVADGIVGPKTWAALFPPEPKPTPAPSGTVYNRFYVDGKKIGSFTKHENVVDLVKENLGKYKDKIVIERFKV